MKDRITDDEWAMLSLIDDPAHRRREPQAYRMACITCYALPFHYCTRRARRWRLYLNRLIGGIDTEPQPLARPHPRRVMAAIDAGLLHHVDGRDLE